jgi:hypothetical protein
MLYREWVQYGGFDALGMWLKAVRGHPAAGRSPYDVITSAYDFMPDAVRERAATVLSRR